ATRPGAIENSAARYDSAARGTESVRTASDPEGSSAKNSSQVPRLFVSSPMPAWPASAQHANSLSGAAAFLGDGRSSLSRPSRNAHQHASCNRAGEGDGGADEQDRVQSAHDSDHRRMS